MSVQAKLVEKAFKGLREVLVKASEHKTPKPVSHVGVIGEGREWGLGKRWRGELCVC